MEKLEIFIRFSCQFFVVNGPIFEEIFGGDVKMTFYMMLKCIYYDVTLHNSKLPECIYTEGHIAFIPG